MSILPALAPLPAGSTLAPGAALLATAALLAWPLPARLGSSLPAVSLPAWRGVSEGGPWPWTQALAAGSDLYSSGGYPFDAVLAWPLLPLLGWPAWVGAGVCLALWTAGLAGAWLGGCWWGCPRAALVCGVAWQAAVAQAPPGSQLVLALLPVAWGLLVRAAGVPSLPGLVAASVAPVTLVALGERALSPYLLLAVPVIGAQARVAGLVAVLATVGGLTGATLLFSAPVLALTQVSGPGLPAIPLSLGALSLATLGLWRARHCLRRVALPVAAVVGGLGIVDGVAAASLGVAVLAGGCAAAADRRVAFGATALVLGAAMFAGTWPLELVAWTGG